jgi:hypothetical protein
MIFDPLNNNLILAVTNFIYDTESNTIIADVRDEYYGEPHASYIIISSDNTVEFCLGTSGGLGGGPEF